jgi:hypothetical protein
MTALPTTWLALLAALQKLDDYDGRIQRVDGLLTAYPLGLLTDPCTS